MRAAAMCVVGVLFGCGGAWAQPPSRPADAVVSAVVGTGKTWDDEGQIGAGPLVGARFERRLLGNTFAEVGIDSLRHERSGRFAAAGRTLLASVTVLQRFGHARAQPYVLGGMALASHKGTFGFPEDNLISNTSSTDFAFAVGGGIAVRASGRFELGPELRLLLMASDTDSAPAFAQWIGVKCGVRF